MPNNAAQLCNRLKRASFFPPSSLIMHSGEKNSVSPGDIVSPCTTACTGTVLLLISAMGLVSPLPYLLPPQEGWGGALSEVTSLINKLARHTSARRAICSQFALCSGGREQSHNLRLVYCGVQPLSHAAKAENRRRESDKSMLGRCTTHCRGLEASVCLGCFISPV